VTDRHYNVAVIGAGPAGIYASDILSKSDLDVSIDLFERLPAPYGLVRYGVAPDHPRIKAIIKALFNVLQRGDIRFLGNIDIGRDVTVAELREYYDAVVVATGANADAPLDIPGVGLPGCYGAADFVSWYDGHPDYPRTWPLEASQVAVLGVGNVALDVSRILAKHQGDEKKLRSVRRKKPPEGFVNYTQATFTKLIDSSPEQLHARMRISHALLLNLLQRDEETGVAAGASTGAAAAGVSAGPAAGASACAAGWSAA